MKTVHVVLDEATLRAERMRALERKHEEGYRAKPVKKGEFDVFDAIQAWPER